MVNHRRIGAQFEREVAKLISSWWGEPFRRTPLSGGWATSVSPGDIMSTKKEGSDFPFSVECKRSKQFSVWTVFHQILEESPMYKWWGQISVAALKVKRVPLLLIKSPRHEVLAIFPDPLQVELRDSAGRTAVIPYADNTATGSKEWIAWEIPFTELVDVNTAAIVKMIVRVGDRAAAAPGGAGTIYLDDFWLIRAAATE